MCMTNYDLQSICLDTIRPLPIRPSNPTRRGELVSSVTSQTFGGYLLVPGTQLNKQQLITAKVSAGQSWNASGVMPYAPPGSS